MAKSNDDDNDDDDKARQCDCWQCTNEEEAATRMTSTRMASGDCSESGAAAAKMTAKASGDCGIGNDGVTARK